MSFLGSRIIKYVSGNRPIKHLTQRSIRCYVGFTPECSLCSVSNKYSLQQRDINKTVWTTCSKQYRLSSPHLSGSIRLYASGVKKDETDQKHQELPNDNKAVDRDSQSDDVPAKRMGILERFKETYKTYGKLLIAVHCATSSVWYGTFFYAAANGLDVIPLLEKLGASQVIIHPFQESGLGNFAVAYLLYKLATPARYTVTVVGTQLTARKLRDWGYMPAVPEGSSIRDFAKEGRDKANEKREKIKDEMKESRDKAKKKAEDLRGDMRDKMQEKIQKYKDKSS